MSTFITLSKTYFAFSLQHVADSYTVGDFMRLKAENLDKELARINRGQFEESVFVIAWETLTETGMSSSLATILAENIYEALANAEFAEYLAGTPAYNNLINYYQKSPDNVNSLQA